MFESLIKGISKFKMQNRQRTIENTDRGKSSFPREYVKIADLYKLVFKQMMTRHKWVKVFKNGPSKTCGRQPLKNLSRPYPCRVFIGCLP